MARSINIDGLTFGEFSIGMDSIISDFFDSKCDQTGEKTVPKNCFANPFNMNICILTSLGCYFSVEEEVWGSERETKFRSRNFKPGSASHYYCCKLKKYFKAPWKAPLLILSAQVMQTHMDFKKGLVHM